MNFMMDLHSHTFFSDGSESPEFVVQSAKNAGLELMALTDHDCVQGDARAVAEGERLGVKVIPAIEMAVSFMDSEMHLIALFADPEHSGLVQMLDEQKEQRRLRNLNVIEKLGGMGMKINAVNDTEGGILSRTHIASALVAGGYRATLEDAYKLLNDKNSPAYCPMKRAKAEDYFEITRDMGALVVMAHPCQLKRDVREAATRLKAMGLWGMEVYYPDHTLRQLRGYRDLALELGLHFTAGSDFHGRVRPQSPMGIVSQQAALDPEIQKTFQIIMDYKAGV